MKINKTMFCLTLFCSTSNYSISDPVEAIFTDIYKNNTWESRETVSGPGSTLRVTQKMRGELSTLIKRFNITSMADAPCGDCNWMRYVDIGECEYIGIDIVKELIENNTRLFGPTRKFKHLNLVENVIDRVDLIICRDMLTHLNYEQIFNVLRNFKQSGSKYLLVTTNLATQKNIDVSNPDDCQYRLVSPFLNLELPPFNFPKPLALIQEDIPFGVECGKHLALWLLDDIDV